MFLTVYDFKYASSVTQTLMLMKSRSGFDLWVGHLVLFSFILTTTLQALALDHRKYIQNQGTPDGNGQESREGRAGHQTGPPGFLGRTQQWTVGKYLNSEMEHQRSLCGNEMHINEGAVGLGVSVIVGRGTHAWKLGCKGRNLVFRGAEKTIILIILIFIKNY